MFIYDDDSAINWILWIVVPPEQPRDWDWWVEEIPCH